MKRSWIILAVLPFVLSGAAVNQSQIDASAYLSCNGTSEDGPALESLIESTGAGKRILIPTGCVVLVGSPGTSNARATFPTGTSLVCEDRNTDSIIFARHYCSGGSFPGSFGSSTATCVSGSKTCDVDHDGDATLDEDGCEFAPTGGSTYKLFDAASSSTNVAIEGCVINARQVEPWARCAGGANSGKACDDNTDCPSSTCSSAPLSPSGTGTINVVDFTNATGALIDKTQVKNLLTSTAGLVVGPKGIIRDSSVGDYGANPVSVAPSFSVAPSVGGATDFVADNVTVTNTLGGVYASGLRANVTNSRVTLVAGTAYGYKLPDQSTLANSTWTLAASSGNVGALLYAIDDSGHTVLNGNRGYAADNTDGVHIKTGVTQAVIQGGTLTGGSHGIIPDVVASGTPQQLVINYRIVGVNIIGQKTLGAALTTGGELVGSYISWQRGTAVQIGYSNGTVMAGNGHAQITGNLFHAQTSGATLVKFADLGNFCASGTDMGEACTCSPDAQSCTGGNSSCAGGVLCGFATHTNVSINGNVFLLPTNAIGIDAQLADSSDATSMLANDIGSNTFRSTSTGTTGIAFPSGATDQSFITYTTIHDNQFNGVATNISNWKDTMGWANNNHPIEPAGPQSNVRWFTNKSGGLLNAGDPVKIETTTDNSVDDVATSDVNVIGVAVQASTNNTTVPVAVDGGIAEACAVDTAAVARGDRLKVSAGTAAKLTPATSTETYVATALTSKSAGSNGTVRCLIGGSAAATASTASGTVCGPVKALNTSSSTNPTQYFPFSYFNASAPTTAESTWQISTSAATITGFECSRSAAPGSTSVVTYRLRKNGANFGDACTITSAAKACSVTVAPGAVSDGDLMNWSHNVATANAAASDGMCCATWSLF